MIPLSKHLDVAFFAVSKTYFPRQRISEVSVPIFPSNPSFGTKYQAKWKIGFLLKSRIWLGFYQSKCRFQEKPHKKILLIALDSTSGCPKRTPMVPETHRYSSQKILKNQKKKNKNPIKIPKIGPIGAPMGPHGGPWGPMGAPMGPILGVFMGFWCFFVVFIGFFPRVSGSFGQHMPPFGASTSGIKRY